MKKLIAVALLALSLAPAVAKAGALTVGPPSRTWAEVPCEELNEIIAQGFEAEKVLAEIDLRAVPAGKGLSIMRLMDLNYNGKGAAREKASRSDCR